MPKNVSLLVNEVEENYSRENFRRVEKYLNRDKSDIRKILANKIIDFSNSYIRHKILTEATILTIRNPDLNKTVVVECTGNYTLTIPQATITSGTYDGTKLNWIYIHCLNEVLESYVVRIETAP